MYKWTFLKLLFFILMFNSCKTKNYNIHKIEYRALGCYGSCPIFSLTINEDKSAEYILQLSDITSKKYSDTIDIFKGTISDKDFTQLITLLNDSNFPLLKDTFRVSYTDAATCILKIKYDNNLVKTIFDDGQEGTYKLKKIYDLLFGLRENQNWK